MTISIQDFSQIDLRVAVITAAEEHPDADKLLVLKVDAKKSLLSIILPRRF